MPPDIPIPPNVELPEKVRVPGENICPVVIRLPNIPVDPEEELYICPRDSIFNAPSIMNTKIMDLNFMTAAPAAPLIYARQY